MKKGRKQRKKRKLGIIKGIIIKLNIFVSKPDRFLKPVRFAMNTNDRNSLKSVNTNQRSSQLVILPLVVVLLIISCSIHKKETFNKEVKVVAKDTVRNHNDDLYKILYATVAELEHCSKRDSVFYPLDDRDTSAIDLRMLAVGRIIDAEKINAVCVSSPDNPTIDFYEYNANKWVKIGSDTSERDIIRMAFKDFDGDHKNEILLEGQGNVNGNNWNSFYHYSNANKIEYSGSFFSGQYKDTVVDHSNYIKVVYEGSWYSNQEKTLYQWINGKLIPLKSVELELKKADLKHDALWIKYYENPTRDCDTLVLKFKKTYRDRNEKMFHLWEDFFEHFN